VATPSSSLAKEPTLRGVLVVIDDFLAV